MTSSSLAAITSLKKLVNHPDLVFPACRLVFLWMNSSDLLDLVKHPNTDYVLPQGEKGGL